MNKILFIVIFLSAVILYADNNKAFYLTEEKLSELRCEALKGDKDTAASVAFYYDYVCDDALSASIWYYVAYRNGSSFGAFRSCGDGFVPKFIKEFPACDAKNEKIDTLTYKYIKYLNKLFKGTKDVELYRFLKFNGVKEDLLNVPNFDIDYLNLAYAITPVEQKYLPILALEGNKKAARRAFLAAVFAGSTAPKYSLILGYIDAILSKKVSSYMKSKIVKETFKISNTNDIFKQIKPDIEKLSNENTMYSNFILYQYFSRNRDCENSKKYYNILKETSIDKRFLDIYEFDGSEIVLSNDAHKE